MRLFLDSSVLLSAAGSEKSLSRLIVTIADEWEWKLMTAFYCRDETSRNLGKFPPKEPLIKSHRGRCGKNWPRARRLRGRIPVVGCNREANTAPGLLSPQPGGLKPFVDFCGVTRSGETAAGIVHHSRLQKSANALQRPLCDLISVPLGKFPPKASKTWKDLQDDLSFTPNALTSNRPLLLSASKDKPVLISALAAKCDVLLTLDTGDFGILIDTKVYGMLVTTPRSFLIAQGLC